MIAPIDPAAVVAALALPPNAIDQRTATWQQSVYVYTQWSEQDWPDVQDALGASHDRFRMVPQRPERPVPAEVTATLFPEGSPYPDPLNSAGYPHLLRKDWPGANVEWGLVLPDRAVLVRVASASTLR